MRDGMSRRALRAAEADLRSAHAAVDRNDLDAALEAARRADAACSAAGVRSAHLAWVFSVIADLRGDLAGAYRHIIAAMDLDPLNLSVRDSFGIIMRNIGRAVGSGREAGGADLGHLYSLLLAENHADEAAHLAMARHLVSDGRLTDALRIVGAVLVLTPRSEAGWRLKAAIERDLGHEQEAAEAGAMAAALDGRQTVMFAPAGTTANA